MHWSSSMKLYHVYWLDLKTFEVQFEAMLRPFRWKRFRVRKLEIFPGFLDLAMAYCSLLSRGSLGLMKWNIYLSLSPRAFDSLSVSESQVATSLISIPWPGITSSGTFCLWGWLPKKVSTSRVRWCSQTFRNDFPVIPVSQNADAVHRRTDNDMSAMVVHHYYT